MTTDAVRIAAEGDVATLCDWLAGSMAPRDLVDVLAREAGRRAAAAGMSRNEMYAAWVSAFSAALIARADMADDADAPGGAA